MALPTLAAVLLPAIGPMAEAADRSGTFKGASRHKTSGTVTLVQTPQGPAIELGADFMLDDAPDAVVGLGAPDYDPATFAGELAALAGRQVYLLPAGIDPAEYDTVYIWCRAYSIPMGIAQLN